MQCMRPARQMSGGPFLKQQTPKSKLLRKIKVRLPIYFALLRRRLQENQSSAPLFDSVGGEIPHLFPQA